MGAHHRKHDVGAVAGRDDGHALGQALQHMLGRHARDQHVERLAVQQRRVAGDHGALDGLLQFGDRRGHQQRLFGQHIALRLERLQRRREHCQLGRIATVCHHRCGVRMLCGDLTQADVDDVRDLVWGATLGLDRQHDWCAEAGRDASVG